MKKRRQLPDVTVEQVWHEHQAHNAVCTERYGNIDARLKSMSEKLENMNTQIHARFNVMSGRIWGAAGAAILVGVGGFGTLAFYLLTKGH